MKEFDEIQLTLSISTPYHLGSGYGLGRVIDSLLRVDSENVPFIPASTFLGIVAQGMFDLLRFACFKTEKDNVCDFHKQPKKKPAPYLPCAILEKEPCLMCLFFGSTAKEGILLWEDLKCATSPELVKAILNTRKPIPSERRQIIMEAASHKRNMRAQTVKEKHFFVQEEGAPLTFAGRITFNYPISSHKARYLAAALKNTRAIGRRKSRGKGYCDIQAAFHDMNSGKTDDVKLLQGFLE